MKQRCLTPTSDRYPLYGGRGISIIKSWVDDFECFKGWAESNGYHEALSLDRIDNNGNYEPTNCRWATQKEQMRNTRTNRLIEHEGDVKTLAEWSEITGIHGETLRKRLERGLSTKDSFLPILKQKKRGSQK
jgi:predicted ATP-grasp superfamily ATP-dependent carboligase